MSLRLPAGRPRARTRLAAIALLTGLLLAALSGVAAPAQEEPGPLVDVVELRGVLDRPLLAYLSDVLERADADGAEVVVVQLDVPGGLNVTAEKLTALVAAARTPVVAWVGPPGARAVGAGAVLLEAADLRAAAPATLLGAPEPVDLAGGGPAAGPLLAVAPTAEARLPEDVDLPPGRAPADVTLATESEAVASGALDLVAASLPDLLGQLDGRAPAGGPTLDVDPQRAQIRFNNPGLLRRVLHTATNPALAYLLLVGGALALLFEVFQPGFGVSGVAGLVTAGIGVYGLAVLPVRWPALAAVVAGLLLLAADLALARLGTLTVAGTAALAAGSFALLPGGPLGLSPWLVGLVVAFTVVFFVVIMTTVLKAQGNQALAGAEHVVGKVGVVRSVLNPEGHVFVGGALWRARVPEEAGRVRTGTQVRVLGMNDRLTLDVEPMEESAVEQPSVAGSG